MKPVYTKRDLGIEIAAKFGFSDVRGKAISDFAINCLASALVAGLNIKLHGLGSLIPVSRKPRVGRNPKDLESGDVLIPLRRAVRLKISRKLKERLNTAELKDIHAKRDSDIDLQAAASSAGNAQGD